jgi:hypothetical protein
MVMTTKAAVLLPEVRAVVLLPVAQVRRPSRREAARLA